MSTSDLHMHMYTYTFIHIYALKHVSVCIHTHMHAFLPHIHRCWIVIISPFKLLSKIFWGQQLIKKCVLSEEYQRAACLVVIPLFPVPEIVHGIDTSHRWDGNEWGKKKTKNDDIKRIKESVHKTFLVKDGKSQSGKGCENEVIFKSVEMSRNLFCREG